MKITFVVWDNYSAPLKRAAEAEGVDIEIFTVRSLEDVPGKIEDFKRSAPESDVLYLNRTTHRFWDELGSFIVSLKDSKRIISVGTDPTYWGWSTVEPEVAIAAYKYLSSAGEENYRRMLAYLDRTLGGADRTVLPPLDIPWEGLVHPRAGRRMFLTTDEYLKWYGLRPEGPWVGLIIARPTWMTEDTKIEDAIIADLEAGFAAVRGE